MQGGFCADSGLPLVSTNHNLENAQIGQQIPHKLTGKVGPNAQLLFSAVEPAEGPAIKGVGRGLDPVAQSDRVDTVDQQRPLAKEQPE